MQNLRSELEPLASTGQDAARIVDEIFDAVVVALRRDRRFAGIPLREFELLLADSYTDAEQRLFDELRDRAPLAAADVLDGVES